MRRESIISAGMDVLSGTRLFIGIATIGSLLTLAATKPVSPPVSLTPPPTLRMLYSLFEGDTCAPPCWFGLTPGESTTEDVIAMFQANEDLFMVNPEVQGDIVVPNLEPLLAGSSSTFVWLKGSRSASGGESHIVLDQGIVDWMRIQMNQDVSLYQTLATFGQPNQVRITVSGHLSLILFYHDLNIIVSLLAEQHNCELLSLSEDYMVSQIYYYSADSFEALQQGLAFDRWIPLPIAIWEMWLRGEPNGPCIDVLEAFLASVDVTPTPTATPIRSLFTGDTCAPPCWFGLIPGESASREVLMLLQSNENLFEWYSDYHSNVFDPETGELVDGFYSVYWRDFERPDDSRQFNSGLVIREGILHWMRIMVNDIVPLRDVLEILGQPDQIYFTIELYGQPLLILEYPQIPFRIYLTSEAHDFTMLNITERFWADYVYYSHRPLEELEVLDWERDNPGIPAVPMETWESWLNNQVNSDCYEAWEQLAETSAS